MTDKILGWESHNEGALWQHIFNLLETAPKDTELMSCHQKQIRPEILGQFLMGAASREDNAFGWHKYWIDVLGQIGPDHLQEISHAVDFMKEAKKMKLELK